jgi:hypothetical protein
MIVYLPTWQIKEMDQLKQCNLELEKQLAKAREAGAEVRTRWLAL